VDLIKLSMCDFQVRLILIVYDSLQLNSFNYQVSYLLEYLGEMSTCDVNVEALQLQRHLMTQHIYDQLGNEI
jgi:hypothetical protein